MLHRPLTAGFLAAFLGGCSGLTVPPERVYSAVSDGRVVVVRLASDHGGELEISGHKVQATWTVHSDTLYFDFGLGAAHFRYYRDSIVWNGPAMNLQDAAAINTTLLSEH